MKDSYGVLSIWLGTMLIGKVAVVSRAVRSITASVLLWLDRIDQGAHRLIKGLRLVTAFGLAAMLGKMPEIVAGLPDGEALSSLEHFHADWK